MLDQTEIMTAHVLHFVRTLKGYILKTARYIGTHGSIYTTTHGLSISTVIFDLG